MVVPQATETDGWVQVVATGFQTGTLLVVELCGSAHPEALETCDAGTAVNAVAGPTGRVSAPLRIQPPEAGCPCSVRISPAGSRTRFDMSVPIAVDGITGALVRAMTPRPPTAAPLVPLQVVNAELVGGGPWTAWFGGSPERTLRYTVENVGDAPITDARVELRAGGPGSTTQELASPPVGFLNPGERRTFRVHVDLDPMAWGQLVVNGEISSASQPVRFTARSSTYPWGLIALTILAVEMLLLSARNRLRRRVAIDPLAADPDLPQRVGQQVMEATVTARRAPDIADSVAHRVLESLHSRGTERAD